MEGNEIRKSVSEEIKASLNDDAKNKDIIDSLVREKLEKFVKEELNSLHSNLIHHTITPLIKELLSLGKKNFTIDLNSKKISINNSLEGIVAILDILLQHTESTESYDDYVIIDNLVNLINDEYEIIGNKIYKKAGQEIIRSIKELNNPTLNDILKSASVSGDMAEALRKLSIFLEGKDKCSERLLNQKLDKKFTDSFFHFVNTKKIRHHVKGEQTPATPEELETFFYFGLSLARLVEIWNGKSNNNQNKNEMIEIDDRESQNIDDEIPF